eukprot:g15652.t1
MHQQWNLHVCKEYLDSETKRLELSIDQVKEMHKALSDEIWGPEEVTDFSPPSLRRLDMQTRQLEKTIKEVLAELRELRLLDAHVKRVTEIQEGHGVQLTELTDTSNEISQRVNQDLKAEIKRTANLMSAYSANLLHEVRSSFSNEDVQVFLKETEASLHSLQESLHSSGRHVEASLREVRLDIESLDSKRKRDKIGLEESITGLQQQASHSSMSASQLGQTLEHLSSILGISLQGQRMIIALGVQDFVDRKDTTYVGLKKGHTGGLKLGPRLDLDSFTDLPGMNPDEDEQLQKRCRYLATAFGFGQGCCVNVYLSAGGYLGDKFDDKYFFVLMCAAVYVTPLLIFALARRLDPYFDRHFGFRSVYQVRLAISMLVGALLVAGLIAATLGTGDQKAAVLALGAAVGCVAGSVASASAQFFGVISPKLVPLFFLGQTASGHRQGEYRSQSAQTDSKRSLVVSLVSRLHGPTSRSLQQRSPCSFCGLYRLRLPKGQASGPRPWRAAGSGAATVAISTFGPCHARLRGPRWDAKEAFKSPGTVLRSSSLPERCFYERCKPSGNFTEVPSALPTNPDWLKTRLAALAEESEFPKVKVRLNRPKNTEIPSPLTGHGERTKCRSPSPRLLGEGVAIGEANKASLGVPWRSLPVYSKGALCQTMITGLSTTRRVQALSEFSEKLNSSTTKELIYPENNGKATEADGHFKNWLISVQNSLQSLNISSMPQVIWYYSSGILVAVLPSLIFFVNHYQGGLDDAYRRHHRLTPHGSVSSVQALAPSENRSGPRPDGDLQAGEEQTGGLAVADEKALVIRWAFRCQILLIGLNISLTPLANVLAHDAVNMVSFVTLCDFVEQEIVLLKLLGDFVGRVLFFCLPAPRRLRLHLALNGAVALLRLPVWAVLLGHALSKEPWLSDSVLLAIWLLFVVSAALGGSWLQVLAIQAAQELEKRAVAARMNIAVYCGFVSGVAFAGLFAIAAKH